MNKFKKGDKVVIKDVSELPEKFAEAFKPYLNTPGIVWSASISAHDCAIAYKEKLSPTGWNIQQDGEHRKLGDYKYCAGYYINNKYISRYIENKNDVKYKL